MLATFQRFDMNKIKRLIKNNRRAFHAVDFKTLLKAWKHRRITVIEGYGKD